MSTTIKVLSICFLLLSGATSCVSRKIVVMKLEDAIRDIETRTFAAHKSGSELESVEVEFFAKTAYEVKGEITIPISVVGLGFGASAKLEESTKIVVKLDIKEWKKKNFMNLLQTQSSAKAAIFELDEKTGRLTPLPGK